MAQVRPPVRLRLLRSKAFSWPGNDRKRLPEGEFRKVKNRLADCPNF
jgi:hypothetical protein